MRSTLRKHFDQVPALWGWGIDRNTPDGFDLIGGLIALIGVSMIMYWPRGWVLQAALMMPGEQGGIVAYLDGLSPDRHLQQSKVSTLRSFQFILVNYKSNSCLLAMEKVRHLPFASQGKVAHTGFGIWRESVRATVDTGESWRGPRLNLRTHPS